MLGEIADPERRIFTLSFHVDYWNRLGWKDPFSQRAFSQRQRRYAQVLDDHRVYTPQMIVNGSDGFVGSYRQRAKESVAEALEQQPKVDLQISAKKENKNVVVEYTLSAGLDEHVVNVAVVERGLRVDVPRGENAGRSLDHHNVVRVFKQVDAKKTGIVKIELPDDVDPAQVAIIGYVQNKKTMAILDAEETVLTKSN